MQTANQFLEKSKDIICKKLFDDKKLASKCHFSYGFPSTRPFGTNSRTRGEAWQRKKFEAIFISPTQFKKGNQIQVLATLIHEIIHIKIGTDKGHGKVFKQAMREVGLEGKATSTHAGKELIDRLNTLNFPKLPLLHLDKSMSLRKKCGTRLIKLTCSCERIIRVSQSTINEGVITCNLCKKEFKGEE